MPVTPLPRLRRRAAFGIKLEAIAGTPETLDATDYKVLAYDPNIQHGIEFVMRRPAGISMGKFAGIPAEYLGRCTVRIEARGSGTPNTLPVWARCIKACGFKESASGSGILVPVSAPEDQDTGTIEVNRDGLLKQLSGCVGNMSIEAVNGRVGFFAFDFMGIWQQPSDETFPNITHETPKPPRVATATCTVGSTTRTISRISIAQNRTIAVRKTIENLAAALHCLGVETDPGGSFDPEANLVADDAFWTDWLASTERALILDWGTTNGNKINIDAPNLQLIDPQEADRDGLATHELAFSLNETTSGDGYMTIAFP